MKDKVGLLDPLITYAPEPELVTDNTIPPDDPVNPV
jgi:hypothetical protein